MAPGMEAMSESLSGPPAVSSDDDAKRTAVEPVPVVMPTLKSPTLRLALTLLAVLLLLLVVVDTLHEPTPAGTSAYAPSPGLVPTPVPGLTCSNAGIASGSQQWADTEPPAGWTVVYATVLQRHWDRWIYAHSLRQCSEPASSRAVDRTGVLPWCSSSGSRSAPRTMQHESSSTAKC
jgi:hypothetical protein